MQAELHRLQFSDDSGDFPVPFPLSSPEFSKEKPQLMKCTKIGPRVGSYYFGHSLILGVNWGAEKYC